MRVKKRLNDDRYLLAEIEFEGRRLIYLRDRLQETESLGFLSGDLDVEELWKDHLTRSDFCLPCELLLHLDPKVIYSKESVAELGLTLEFLKKVRGILEER